MRVFLLLICATFSSVSLADSRSCTVRREPIAPPSDNRLVKMSTELKRRMNLDSDHAVAVFNSSKEQLSVLTKQTIPNDKDLLVGPAAGELYAQLQADLNSGNRAVRELRLNQADEWPDDFHDGAPSIKMYSRLDEHGENTVVTCVRFAVSVLPQLDIDNCFSADTEERTNGMNNGITENSTPGHGEVKMRQQVQEFSNALPTHPVWNDFHTWTVNPDRAPQFPEGGLGNDNAKKPSPPSTWVCQITRSGT